MKRALLVTGLACTMGCRPRGTSDTRGDAAPARPSPHEVFGRVLHAEANTVVIGEDGAGVERARLRPDGRGEFRAEVPLELLRWRVQSAGVDGTAAVRLPPGTGVPLVLDAAPAPELRVRVRDERTGAPIAARVVIQGRAGTLDPSFGSEFGAEGAGPVLDLVGETSVRILPGKYRVVATRGPAWSVSVQDLSLVEGSAEMRLALRDELGLSDKWSSCDFHVHSARSFDSKVQPSDRARSLMAAGIDFAVPTEHNTPGSYPTDLGLAWAPGVEVTPEQPSFGHVGAFPWQGDGPPKSKGTSPDGLYTELRTTQPKALLVLHHPRFKNDAIGLFETTPSEVTAFRYDGLELMNGYDNAHPDHVVALLEDLDRIAMQGKHPFLTAGSDAHNLLYSWAGYPRAYVRYAGSSLRARLSALKEGHLSLSSGPVVLFDVDGHGSGSLVRGGRTATLHARVLAADWVRVARISFFVGGLRVKTFEISPDAKEVERADVRWAISLPRSGMVTAVAEGAENLNRVVPFLDVQPLGVAGPVWLQP